MIRIRRAEEQLKAQKEGCIDMELIVTLLIIGLIPSLIRSLTTAQEYLD